MSSLRLALKKSMEEVKRGGKGTTFKKHTSKHGDENGEGREWDETPRKRGRPRKQPAPRDVDNDEENFSSENEFSVGHADEDDGGDLESQTSARRRDSSHEAANRIQKQWKKQHKLKVNEEEIQPSASSEKGAHKDTESSAVDQHSRKTSSPVPPANLHYRPTSPEVSEQVTLSSTTTEGKSAALKTGKPRTVPPPSQFLASWQTNHIAPKRARKNIVPGLRVKVRFALRKEGGKKKKKWFGGLIAAVSKEGTKVKIMYDDGTHEITKFPDKDIVIDDTDNGEHKAHSAIIEMFLPPEQEIEATEAGEAREILAVPAIENSTRLTNEKKDISDKSKMSDTANPVQSAGFLKRDETDSQPAVASEKESTESSHSTSNYARDDSKQHPDAVSSRKPDLERDAPEEHTSVRAKEISQSESLRHPVEESAKIVPQHASNDTVLSKEIYLDEPEPSSTDSLAEQPKKRKRGRPPKVRPSDSDDLRSNQYCEATSDSTKPDLSVDPGHQARGPLSIRIPLGKLEHHLPGRSPKAANSFEIPREKYDTIVPSPKGVKRKQSDPALAGQNSPHNRAVDEMAAGANSQSSPRHKKKIRKLLDSSEKESLSGVDEDPLLRSMPAPLNENLVPIIIAGDSPPQSGQSVQDDALGVNESRNAPELSTMHEESDTTPARARNKQESQEGAPLVRSGRRAAHQANERIVAKVDSSEHLVKIKKKKHQDDEPEWVQCDRCSKWRVIPSNLIDSLPKQWFCEDNVHDKKRATCDAPEQTQKEVAKERKRAKKKKRIMEAAAAAEGEKSERTRSPYPFKNADELAQSNKRYSPDLDINLENAEDRTKSDRKAGPMGAKKGRPTYASSDTLDTAMESIPEIRRGRGRPRRNASQGDKESAHHHPNKGNNTDDADNVEWVQCEKCDKWRKLPPHISASELPDVWYCNMNTWSSSLTCDDPEDKADGLLDIGFLGTAGATGKLSYRNLIFGSTGRKANRPISERTRAAESLFGTIEESEDVPPIVKYSNCSAFISRSKVIPGCEENKCPSLFDVMQTCSFVSELRSIQEEGFATGHVSEADGGASLIFGQTFDTLPQESKKFVEKFVLEALDSSTASGEEVTRKVNFRSRESLSDGELRALSYCSFNVVVTALCALAKEGVLEIVHPGGAMWTASDWNPRYRKARPQAPGKSAVHSSSDSQRKDSRFMKISKPWKRAQMQ